MLIFHNQSIIPIGCTQLKQIIKFISEFNSHKSKSNRIKKSVYEIEEKSMGLADYVIGHKDYIRISKQEYQELLKYKEDHQKLLKDSNTLQKFRKFKLISLEQQQEIKEKAKTGINQRALALEFNTNVATVNKIINIKNKFLELSILPSINYSISICGRFYFLSK